MGVPKVFTVFAEHAGLTADTNLLQLTAPSTAKLQILSASISNTSNETNEQLMAMVSVASAAGTGTSTSVTPKVTDGSTATSSATAKHTFGTLEPTLATPPVYKKGFPSLPGWDMEPRLAEALVVPESGILVFSVAGSSGSFTTVDLLIMVTYRETETNAPILE